MATTESIVGIFPNHPEAEVAVRELHRAGFAMNKLSIIGKDFVNEEHVVGYYTTGDRMAYWGKLGAFWGGLWGLLVGSAFFWLPGLGPVLVGGPLVAAILGGLEGAALSGGIGVIGAGLVSLGVPKNSALKYEVALRANQFVLIAHGTPEEVARAQGILESAGALSTNVHAEGEVIEERSPDAATQVHAPQIAE